MASAIRQKGNSKLPREGMGNNEAQKVMPTLTANRISKPGSN